LLKSLKKISKSFKKLNFKKRKVKKVSK